MIKRGSVIQANEQARDWFGCLLMVDEVKTWGVQAFMQIPMQGTAYVRLTHDQYDYIGDSKILQEGDDE